MTWFSEIESPMAPLLGARVEVHYDNVDGDCVSSEWGYLIGVADDGAPVVALDDYGVEVVVDHPVRLVADMPKLSDDALARLIDAAPAYIEF